MVPSAMVPSIAKIVSSVTKIVSSTMKIILFVIKCCVNSGKFDIIMSLFMVKMVPSVHFWEPDREMDG